MRARCGLCRARSPCASRALVLQGCALLRCASAPPAAGASRAPPACCGTRPPAARAVASPGACRCGYPAQRRASSARGSPTNLLQCVRGTAVVCSPSDCRAASMRVLGPRRVPGAPCRRPAGHRRSRGRCAASVSRPFLGRLRWPARLSLLPPAAKSPAWWGVLTCACRGLSRRRRPPPRSLPALGCVLVRARSGMPIAAGGATALSPRSSRASSLPQLSLSPRWAISF